MFGTSKVAPDKSVELTRVMRFRSFLFIAFACTAVHAHAQWMDQSTGQALPDTKSRKSSGVTGASLVLTGDAASFIKEWTSSPESHAPRVPRLGPVRRGDSVWALLFFTGCGTEKTICDAIVDFTVLNPDGSVYAEQPGNKVSTQPSGKPGIIYLSQSYLQVRIEPQDSLGRYRVLALFKQGR